MSAPSPSELDGRLLTTSEAARLLGSSRQTIVTLCETGDLPYVLVGTHRRLEAADVLALRERTRRRPASVRRSQWLAHAAAGLVATDPEPTLAAAHAQLATMQSAGPRGRSRLWLERWQVLLDGPVDGVLDALTGRTVEHDELRQHSPFTSLLGESHRLKVLQAYERTRAGRGRLPGSDNDGANR